VPTRLTLHLLLESNLTTKNRIFRSNVSARFDNYDGSGSQARIENPLGWDEESRFLSREAMTAEIMSVFDPPPFV
jgi:hypothetical protein